MTKIASFRPTLVRLTRVGASSPDVLSLSGALPAPHLLPDSLTAAATGVVSSHGLQYGWAEGNLAIRTWIVERMKSRGAVVDTSDIIVTHGAQEALSLIASVLPNGSRVAFDEETYPGAIKAMSLFHHRPVKHGDEADACYVIDGIANPYGIDNVRPRREALLASKLQLIVDEAYAELQFGDQRLRPLYADAPDRVWHVGSTSKSIAPGLRIGWVIPPRHRLQDVLRNKDAFNLETGTYAQAVLAAWLKKRGRYDRLVERARRLYSARAERLMSSLVSHLPQWRPIRPEGGMSLWVETDLEGDDVDFLGHATTYGVSFDPGSMFRAFPSNSDKIAMRLSFSHGRFDQIDEAIRRLKTAALTFNS